MEQWSETQRDAYFLSGKLPESKPAESTTAKDEPVEDTQDASTKPESGTGTTPKAKSADTRKAQLADDIQDLLNQRKQLRAELEAEKSAKAPPKQEAKAQEPPARPRLENFETFEQYEEARDGFAEDLADFKVQAALSKARAEDAEKLAKAESERKSAEIRDTWDKRVKAFEQGAADFKDVAYSKDIRVTDEMAYLIRESDVGPELLYHLGKNAELASELAGMPPLKLAKEIAKLEIQIEKPQDPKKNPVDGLFKPKLVTNAGPPARELAGNATAVADPIKAAIDAGDFATYKHLTDAKEIALRKQG